MLSFCRVTILLTNSTFWLANLYFQSMDFYSPHHNPFEYAVFGEDSGTSSSSSSTSSTDEAMVIDYGPASSPRLINASAESFFHSFINRRVIIERPFVDPAQSFREVIFRHGWAYLARGEVVVNLDIVREFYANSHVGNIHSVFVRGKFLKVTRRSINSHFHLCEYHRDTYSQLLRADNTDHLLAAVTIPGATWARNARYEALYVPINELTAEAKMWLMFINSKLLPADPSIRVSKERVLLIYAILHDFSVDVGKLISGFIRRAQRNPLAPMFFPALLTAMARERGVDVSSLDNPQHAHGLMGLPQWPVLQEEERAARLGRGM